MRLSDDKVSHLTHIVLKGLLKKKLLRFSLKQRNKAWDKKDTCQGIKTRRKYDESIRKKTPILFKEIQKDAEWEVLYTNFFRRAAKKGRG